MPLDKDNYRVRRYYRHGILELIQQKTTRNPKTGAITGKASVVIGRMKYERSAFTNSDASFWGEKIQRVKLKVVVPYSREFETLDHSKVNVKINNTEYNIEMVDTQTYNDRMFIYLAAVTGRKGGDMA